MRADASPRPPEPVGWVRLHVAQVTGTVCGSVVLVLLTAWMCTSPCRPPD
jgi:hypothetical protein